MYVRRVVISVHQKTLLKCITVWRLDTDRAEDNKPKHLKF